MHCKICMINDPTPNQKYFTRTEPKESVIAYHCSKCGCKIRESATSVRNMTLEQEAIFWPDLDLSYIKEEPPPKPSIEDYLL